MGSRVTTPNLRFEFVEKTAAECGDGTAFPMEVTLDQVAEIFYRVKDAWFTGGSASWKVGIFGSTQTLNASTSAPTNRSLEIDGVTYQKRGYTILDAYPYNGATYDAGIGNYYSDIADNENGLWKDAWNDPDHVDAFSFEQDDPNSIQTGDPNWWGMASAGAFAKVYRGKRVAVVKLDPTDELYAVTNKFYLEIEMYWFDYGVLPFGGSTNIYDSQGGFGDFSSRAVLICNYILRLQTGDATCPVYFDALGSTNETGTDFIQEPQEWFPYAKNNPAVPVWDFETGAKL